jgi:hypothetical protein
MSTYEEETALIKRLEAETCPPFIKPSKENNWCPDNSAYWAHVTAIKDAYWRRRMLSARPGEIAPG